MINISASNNFNVYYIIEKISILKKGNRDRKRKVCKQVRDQKKHRNKLKMELSDHRTKK